MGNKTKNSITVAIADSLAVQYLLFPLPLDTETPCILGTNVPGQKPTFLSFPWHVNKDFGVDS